MTERVLLVTPEQGWGWLDDGETRDWDYAPDPFHAQLRLENCMLYGRECRSLVGQIVEPKHEFDGFDVSISERNDPFNGAVTMILSKGGRALGGMGIMEKSSFDD